MTTPTISDELKLTRALDTIQRNIWARINDEAVKQGVKLSIDDAYGMGQSIKEVLHPQVLSLLADFAERITPEKKKGLPSLEGLSMSEIKGHNACVDTITKRTKEYLS